MRLSKELTMDALEELEAERAAEPAVRREVEIDAAPEEVWQALSTENGRERWLEDDPEREVHVEVADEPSRLVWWWWQGDEPATRVEFLVSPVPTGTRVVVTETVPRAVPTARFPLAALAGAFAPVAA
jgi:uncharacterized protein YndB with AHSA1/START domain